MHPWSRRPNCSSDGSGPPARRPLRGLGIRPCRLAGGRGGDAKSLRRRPACRDGCSPAARSSRRANSTRCRSTSATTSATRSTSSSIRGRATVGSSWSATSAAIEPGESQRVFLPAKWIANGTLTIAITLSSASTGLQIDGPTYCLLDVQTYWETAVYIVTGVLVVALFGFGIYRNIVRRRRMAAGADARAALDLTHAPAEPGPANELSRSLQRPPRFGDAGLPGARLREGDRPRAGDRRGRKSEAPTPSRCRRSCPRASTRSSAAGC